MDKEVYDTSDEKQVKKRKKQRDLRRETELYELEKILSTYEGRSFLWRLIAFCGIYEAGVTHELETFRQLGKRDIGLWLLAEIDQANPKAIPVMTQEEVTRVTKEKN
jgi:hypothetical protein|tara:strand:+ start:2444 stop:2764 length:321 start_codon:yes stop_codon:yes gene_type:complete